MLTDAFYSRSSLQFSLSLLIFFFFGCCTSDVCCIVYSACQAFCHPFTCSRRQNKDGRSGQRCYTGDNISIVVTDGACL